MNLEGLAKNLKRDRSDFFSQYISGDATFRRKANKVMEKSDFIRLVQYAWNTKLKSEWEIPEALKSSTIEDIIGPGVFIQLGVRQGCTNDLLEVCFDDYGKMDDRKAAIFIERKDRPTRARLYASFFRGKQKTKNINALVSYAWENVWKHNVTIPEQVDSYMIYETLGDRIYLQVGVDRGNVDGLLDACLKNYGVFNKEKLKFFVDQPGSLRKKLVWTFLGGKHKESNAKSLLKYTWHNLWSKEFPIPELLTNVRVEQDIGGAMYKAMGIKPQSINALLSSVIKEYGSMDDKKIKYYIDHSSLDKRRSLTYAFFVGEKARDNTKALIRYAWEKAWKSKVIRIPELVTHKRIVNTIGNSPYKVFGLTVGVADPLLAECLENYGILDNEKIRVYLSTKRRSEKRVLGKTFLQGEHAIENALAIVNYAWENIIRSEQTPIPELASRAEHEFTLGLKVYDVLNITRCELSSILKRALPDYGLLTEEKLQTLVNIYPDQSVPRRRQIGKIFFSDDNPECISNAENYLATYQQHHQRRRSDLTYSDFMNLPKGVKRILDINGVGDLREIEDIEIPPAEPSYRVIQIRWSPKLEQELSNLLQNQEDPVNFIGSNPQIIWDTLGTTPFGAHMKAQELGLIPPTVVFGNGEREELPTYRLIEFPGYEFTDYALQTAPRIDSTREIDAHLFTSPVHHQNFHVNIPIFYRGIEIDDYSNQEAAILNVIGAYLRNPNDFERVTRRVNDRNIVYEHVAPDNINTIPRIVPIIIGDEQLTQVFLPARYSLDRGGIYTSVLSYQTGAARTEIFLFRHNERGIIM